MFSTFVNKTRLEFPLKEGTAGVYRQIGILCELPTAKAEPSAENMFTLQFDALATYREYTVESGWEAEMWSFNISSYYLLDYATVNVAPDPRSPEEIVILGDLRIQPEAETEAKPESLVSRILNVFRRT